LDIVYGAPVLFGDGSSLFNLFYGSWISLLDICCAARLFDDGSRTVVREEEVVLQRRMMAIPTEDRKYFEDMGEAAVRLQFDVSGFSYPRQNSARDWLAELEEAHRKRNEALQAEQMRMAQNTLNAAMIAAGAAIITVVISILAWVFPLHY
jgi:hypothetical protein